MDPRFWMGFLHMLGFMPRWTFSDPPERTETVGEGMSVNIPFNTTERCVQLSRRADSNHTWMKCLVCLEKAPLCPEFRNRCSVYLHGLTLHNVSKADAGIYSITPHLNGNRITMNIVHLVVLGRQPSSTQGPPDSCTSGTTASAVTGPMDYHILLGIIVAVIAIVAVIVIVGVIVLKKFGLSLCRRRQSSEPPDSNTTELQPRPAQPNERQVDQAQQEQDPLVNGRAQEDEECV